MLQVAGSPRVRGRESIPRGRGSIAAVSFAPRSFFAPSYRSHPAFLPPPRRPFFRSVGRGSVGRGSVARRLLSRSSFGVRVASRHVVRVKVYRFLCTHIITPRYFTSSAKNQLFTALLVIINRIFIRPCDSRIHIYDKHRRADDGL